MARKTPVKKRTLVQRGTGAHPGRPKAPRWMVYGAAVFAIAVSLSAILFSLNLNDEGVTTMGAWRVVRGELPYRDFFSIITPFSFYYLALAFKLGGVSILTERIAGALLGVALVLLTAKLSLRTIAHPTFAALPVAVLCGSGVGVWPFPSHHWLASVLVIGALVCAERALEGDPFRWSVGAGACGALAFWSLQDQGAYLWLAVGFLFVPWLGRDRALRIAAGWLVGGLATSLPFLVLLLRVPWPTLWYDLVGFNLTAYREANESVFVSSLKEFHALWTSGGWSEAPWSMGNVVFTSAATILMPLLCIPVVVWGWWRRWDSGPRCALLAAGCVSFVGTILHRWAPINLQWGQALPAVAVAWALAHWHAKATGRARWAPLAVSLVVMGAFLLVGAQRMRANLDPQRVLRVTASAGTLRTNNPYEARYTQETLDQIESRLAPGQPLLTTGLPFINFWTRRPSPVPYDWFMPPVLTTPAQTRDSIRLLDERPLEWILTTRAFEAGDQPFTAYLKSHYSRTWENPACGLWHRNSEAR